MKPSIVCSFTVRSEEHTSELQSRLHLVCRLLLEKTERRRRRRGRRQVLLQLIAPAASAPGARHYCMSLPWRTISDCPVSSFFFKEARNRATAPPSPNVVICP